MIATLLKKVVEDSGFKIGVLGTSITFSIRDLNEYIAVVAGVSTIIYTAIRCYIALRDEKRKSKEENKE